MSTVVMTPGSDVKNNGAYTGVVAIGVCCVGFVSD
jgi:hypothetical protein